jgi:hypothetical protein
MKLKTIKWTNNKIFRPFELSHIKVIIESGTYNKLIFYRR